ncbi:MAG: VPLPA-CTERM sorting domain-containing protein [Gammaproteobacteria bacterium]|nr:VPLPA-CTERM sorting domain-containing protein [Gammaproteobacteria bacterium]
MKRSLFALLFVSLIITNVSAGTVRPQINPLDDMASSDHRGKTHGINLKKGKGPKPPAFEFPNDFNPVTPLKIEELRNFHAYGKGYKGFDKPSIKVSPVPVPAAVWLFMSGLIGMVGIARRKKSFK